MLIARRETHTDETLHEMGYEKARVESRAPAV